MLASVLRSPRAIAVKIALIRTLAGPRETWVTAEESDPPVLTMREILLQLRGSLVLETPN
jgi:hypothetical protein